ncbi:D-alanyl-D-alanine carboxypeptidase [Asanoa hainanensis]|uniref:D-alanyl-D-alanine carboxypeptidase n=1 Tax=Asanoa hainanensis TaxID=560556 RepID=A0A239N797_9ACTN|nr:M15 family metallopeptidase [Asanoa hainanensis]SNT50610.1 D-alanyl-D-alanine carboxypeptidase [Asanoa hainanensis]
MPKTGVRAALLLFLVGCISLALGACSGAKVTPTARIVTPSTAPPTPSPSPSPSLAPSPTPTISRVGNATAAPTWLGTRVVKTGVAQPTPPELRNRSIVTVDDLPPPADGRFHATNRAVPADVLARSSWTKACPVAATDLRYLTVSFRGFDGRAHTGELLVNAKAATDLIKVFRQLFAANFPIERMHISSAADMNAPSTGDGNTTEAFACRPVRGQKAWSQHSYGLAVDVNPFQNPYQKAKVVLPELATSYLDRTNLKPGMVAHTNAGVKAFASIGWQWGGDYHSLKDYMHFSANGG